MPDKKKAKQADGGSMPVTGHLRELRNRIVVSVVVLFVGICLSLSFASGVVKFLTHLGTQYDYHFVYLKPQELLLSYFQIALIGGVVIAIPVIAYEVYAFCAPALEKKGKVTFIVAMLVGALCFVIGVCFAYFIVVPFMLNFLIKFSAGMDIANTISIGEYLSFLMTIFVIFGVIFEMPVVSVLLTSIGIMRSEWLAKSRKVMIVVIFFVAAVITPPDVVSQIMVALPMILLFELSIMLSRVVGRKKQAAQEAMEEEE